MGRILCQMCNTIVDYGENHPCFSRKNDDMTYILPHQDETEEVSANIDETTEQCSETSNVYDSKICETAPQATDASQASSSRGPSVLSTGNKELKAGTSEAVLQDRLGLPEASFNVPNTKIKILAKGKESTKPNEIQHAMAEPSTVHPRSFAPDGQKLYACDLCHFQCNQKIDLVVHYRMHRIQGRKPHVCDACGKCFAKKWVLNNHARTHTGERPYVCKTCRKCFTQKSHLSKHTRLHRGEEPYKCETCGKIFSSKWGLTEHARRHTGERPHKCKICEKRFTHKSSLNLHSKIHKGLEPYKCETCGKSWIKKYEFDRHMRSHTGDKPFSCPICGRCFSIKSNCKRHIATHDREKRYKCE